MTTEFFEKLNRLEKLKFIMPEDLVINEKYVIANAEFKKILTMDEPRIMCKIEMHNNEDDVNMFLPLKYNEYVKEKDLVHFIGCTFVYKGKEHEDHIFYFYSQLNKDPDYDVDLHIDGYDKY